MNIIDFLAGQLLSDDWRAPKPEDSDQYRTNYAHARRTAAIIAEIGLRNVAAHLAEAKRHGPTFDLRRAKCEFKSFRTEGTGLNYAIRAVVEDASESALVTTTVFPTRNDGAPSWTCSCDAAHSWMGSCHHVWMVMRRWAKGVRGVSRPRTGP